jgi:hypothetical protein
MRLTLIILRAIFEVLSEFIAKAMVIVLALWLAVRWGII